MFVLSTDSLKGYGLNRIFQFAKEAGYDGLDLAINPQDYDTQNPEYVKSLCDQYQIPVVAIQTPAHGTPKKINMAVEMAKTINCKIIVIQPPKLLELKFIQWLKREIPKIRQKENISIALENAPSSNFLGILPGHAMDNLSAMKEFKHACIDTSRVAQKKQDIIRVYRALHKYIVHMHLSNVRGSQLYHLPDKGVLPLESLLSKMKQEDYPGAFSLKTHPKHLNAGDDEKVVETLKQAKKFYEKYFAQQTIAPTESNDNGEEESENTESTLESNDQA